MSDSVAVEDAAKLVKDLKAAIRKRDEFHRLWNQACADSVAADRERDNLLVRISELEKDLGAIVDALNHCPFAVFGLSNHGREWWDTWIVPYLKKVGSK